MTDVRFPRLLAFALLLPLAGCSCGSKRRAGADAGTAAASTGATTPEAPARVDRPVSIGTVRGRVLLAPGTELPRWTLEEVDRGEDRPNWPENCPPPRDSDTLPVTGVGSPTALVGILVSATGESEAFFRNLGEWVPKDRPVSIQECRLSPKMVAATVGDTLVITNHTNAPYLPTAGPSEYFEALMLGQSRRVTLEHGGLSWIKCGFSLSCLRSELVVLRHPVHTVTGSDGSFELRNVPSDMAVQIHAWHPYFREATVETRVGRNGTTEVEITITPVVRTAPSQRPVVQTGGEAGPMADFPGGQILETPQRPQRPRAPRR